jgi:hypothetical protein
MKFGVMWLFHFYKHNVLELYLRIYSIPRFRLIFYSSLSGLGFLPDLYPQVSPVAIHIKALWAFSTMAYRLCSCHRLHLWLRILKPFGLFLGKLPLHFFHPIHPNVHLPHIQGKTSDTILIYNDSGSIDLEDKTYYRICNRIKAAIFLITFN